MTDGRMSRARRADPEEPAAVWKEKELLGGRVVDAGVMILRTSGCSHYHAGGCSMCGYNIESMGDIGPVEVARQMDKAFERLGQVEFLKVYTSGSFLDSSEIGAEPRTKLLRRCSENGTRLLFESRPEFVTEQSLQEIFSVHDKIELALGLESANDAVLDHSISKGFHFSDYEQAADLAHAHGADVRTYVLLKPPFLSEAEAIADSIATMRAAATTSETLSLNPVNVQRGTLVEKLWKSWAYRPPWLWSVLEVMKASQGLSKRVVSDPSGGGKERGAHNCGECDGIILDSLKRYSLNQDHGELGSPECDCHESWRTELDLEDYAVGSIDLQRHFRKKSRRSETH